MIRHYIIPRFARLIHGRTIATPPISNKAILDSESNRYLKATFHQANREFLGYHGHTFWEFFLVTKGSYNHNLNGIKMQMHQGMAYLIRPCDCHSIVQNEENSSCLFITVSIENMKEACSTLSKDLYEFLMGRPSLPCSLADHQIRKLLDLCFYIQARLSGDPKEPELPSSLLVFNFLSAVIDQNYVFSDSKPDWLLDLLKRIQAPENRAWHVSDVMENANYSHSHVSRSFQKYMGCSIIDYISEVKMQNAGDLLIYSDMTIYEISSALGYKSPTNFSAVFKAAYGLSPAQYRKLKQVQKVAPKE